MTTAIRVDWSRANQLALMCEVNAVRAALERLSGHEQHPARGLPEPGAASALDAVCRTFDLSSFERKVLVLCAAIELDGEFAGLCARAQGDPQRAFPTFGLALAAFDDAHWSALTSQSPLRRWALVRVARDAPLTAAALQIDEYVLHDVAGVPELDARLRLHLAAATGGDELAPSQQQAVERILRLLSAGERETQLVQLAGRDAGATRGVAAAVFATLGTPSVAIDARTLPSEPVELDALLQVWSREHVLRGTALFLDAHGLDESNEGLPATRFAEAAAGLVLLGVDRPLLLKRREAYTLDVGKPTRAEQRALWKQALAGDGDSGGTCDELAAHFDFTQSRIRAAAGAMRAETGDSRSRAWAAARAGARTALDRLSQRLDGAAAAETLVLPAAQRELVDDIVAHARHRMRVYEEWGMGRAGERGLGLSALFHGPSGTGKTLAAEAIGAQLHLDVYRVDLSRLVDKYVGETEKNLRRVFDAAEDGGAILLFDECDAIFGKRGEVQAGHDRYANVEVSYLLQRMEAYRGLAILTTNLRNAIDNAFLRRIRFVVAFPFPDYDQRLAIWERSFPAAVPTEGLDFTKVARLNVAGGNIRNIALHAAFLAVDRGQPVRMEHVLRAARAECVKIERAPSALEIGGWV
jgi:hypothetical protein